MNKPVMKVHTLSGPVPKTDAFASILTQLLIVRQAAEENVAQPYAKAGSPVNKNLAFFLSFKYLGLVVDALRKQRLAPWLVT
jgi:hypothetical protein